MMTYGTGIETGKRIYFWPYDVQIVCACPSHPDDHTLITFQNGNAVEVKESIEEIVIRIQNTAEDDPEESWKHS